MNYIITLSISIVLTAFITLWLFSVNQLNVNDRANLPRNKIMGIVLGIPCLLWCIPHTRPILPVSLHGLLIPVIIVFLVLSYKCLDYLFARSFGGFCILSAHYLLQQSFANHTSVTLILVLFLYLLGIQGLFFAGKPYLMRDVIRNIANNRRWKYIVCGLYLSFIILNIIDLILNL